MTKSGFFRRSGTSSHFDFTPVLNTHGSQVPTHTSAAKYLGGGIHRGVTGGVTAPCPPPKSSRPKRPMEHVRKHCATLPSSGCHGRIGKPSSLRSLDPKGGCVHFSSQKGGPRPFMQVALRRCPVAALSEHIPHTAGICRTRCLPCKSIAVCSVPTFTTMSRCHTQLEAMPWASGRTLREVRWLMDPNTV